MITLDFETKAIVKGSSKSPIPVGLAVYIQSNKPLYFSWGHHIENNSTFEQVRDILYGFNVNSHFLFHNAKFDLRILQDYFDFNISGDKLHDTMIMAYLNNPREPSFSLKTLAPKYCGIQPDAQMDLKQWILRNVKQAKESNWGAYIAEAPGNLVGKYAKDDVLMTYSLYKYYSSHMEKII